MPRRWSPRLLSAGAQITSCGAGLRWANRQRQTVSPKLAQQRLGVFAVRETFQTRTAIAPAPSSPGSARCHHALLDQACQQRQPRFTLRSLLPLALVQAHVDLVQLCLTHDAQQPKQKPTVVGARIIEPLGVAARNGMAAPGGSGGSPRSASGLGWNDLRDHHAWISVPSTGKGLSDPRISSFRHAGKAHHRKHATGETFPAAC